MWRNVDILLTDVSGEHRLHLQGIRNPRAMNQREQVDVEWVPVKDTQLYKNRKGRERGRMGNRNVG
jgi:hypothetical protein